MAKKNVTPVTIPTSVPEKKKEQKFITPLGKGMAVIYAFTNPETKVTKLYGRCKSKTMIEKIQTLLEKLDFSCYIHEAWLEGNYEFGGAKFVAPENDDAWIVDFKLVEFDGDKAPIILITPVRRLHQLNTEYLANLNK